MSIHDDLGEELLRAALAPPARSRLPDALRVGLAYAAGLAAGKSKGWKKALALAVPALLVGLGLGWGLTPGISPGPTDKVIYYSRQIPPAAPSGEGETGVWMARTDPAVVDKTHKFSAPGIDHASNPWSVGYFRQHLESLGEDKQ